MRILYVSQYFPPEMGAPQGRVSEFAKAWAAAGNEVHVLTGMPNYPTGVLPAAYRGKVLVREAFGAARIVRTYIYATSNRGIVKRSMAYVSYALSAVGLGQWFAPKPEIVVATSPPILVALAGWAIARMRGAPFVFEVRDLWPESIVAVGALPADHPAIGAMQALEEFLYAEADRVVVLTDSFRERLMARGVPAEKLHVVTNGVDLGRFKPGHETEKTRRELGLMADDVVCSYVGTIGMAHALDTVIDVARRCRGITPRIVFLIVGDGAERRRLEQRVRSERLDNVIFLGVQPRERIPALYDASDICVVPLRRAELFTTVIPSKIFEIMAMAKPIIISVDGEARAIVERSGGGLFTPPEDVEAMYGALVELAREPERRRQMGRAASEFVRREYDRTTLAERYLGYLRAVHDGQRDEQGGRLDMKA